MAEQRPQVEMTLPGTPRAVAQIRAAVSDSARSCGFSGDRLDALRTAISEAATNAVVHGYRDHEGQITVTAQLDAAGVLRVVVPDEGHGMLPRRDSEGLGLGIPLMTTLADHLNVDSRGAHGGTVVEMHFRNG